MNNNDSSQLKSKLCKLAETYFQRLSAFKELSLLSLKTKQDKKVFKIIAPLIKNSELEFRTTGCFEHPFREVSQYNVLYLQISNNCLKDALYNSIMIKCIIEFITLKKEIEVFPAIVLGGGTRCSTYVCLGVWGSRQVCIKFIFNFVCDERKKNRLEDWFEQETKIIKNLRNKNLLVHLLDIKLSNCKILITNLYPFGNLDSLFCSLKNGNTLKQNNYMMLKQGLTPFGSKISPFTLAYFLKQIFEVVSFIHKRGLIHRDIKPANLFVDSNYTIGLGDFQLCISNKGKELLKLVNQGTYNFCGSDAYLRHIVPEKAYLLDINQMAKSIFYLYFDCEYLKQIPELKSQCKITFDCKSLITEDGLYHDSIGLRNIIKSGSLITYSSKESSQFSIIQKSTAFIKQLCEFIHDHINPIISTSDSCQETRETSYLNIHSGLKFSLLTILSQKRLTNEMKHLYVTHHIQEINVKPNIMLSEKRLNRKFLIELQKKMYYM